MSYCKYKSNHIIIFDEFWNFEWKDPIDRPPDHIDDFTIKNENTLDLLDPLHQVIDHIRQSEDTT